MSISLYLVSQNIQEIVEDELNYLSKKGGELNVKTNS